jgi:hypothetical protein
MRGVLAALPVLLVATGTQSLDGADPGTPRPPTLYLVGDSTMADKPDLELP